MRVVKTNLDYLNLGVILALSIIFRGSSKVVGGPLHIQCPNLILSTPG